MKLTCLSLLLLFTASVSSTAHHHDGRETPVIISARKGGLNDGDELATRATFTLTSNKNGGRKMLGTQNVMMKLDKGNSMNAVEMAAGSKDLGGKCDNHVIKGSKAKCKNNNPSTGHFSDDDDSGFEAFTKDYYSPRHHPPKNN